MQKLRRRACIFQDTAVACVSIIEHCPDLFMHFEEQRSPWLGGRIFRVLGRRQIGFAWEMHHGLKCFGDIGMTNRAPRGRIARLDGVDDCQQQNEASQQGDAHGGVFH